jgi:hypothetical protein
MKLYAVRNPVTNVDYIWPLARQRVQVSDQRRVSLQHIPGADGAQSQYGLLPFPRGETYVSITFRVTPKQRGTTFFALRSALNLAIDHGLPQRLTFVDDNNQTWFATGWLMDKSLEYNEDQQWFADWTVKYVLEDPIAYAPDPSVIHWGDTGMKWGAAGRKWGESPHTTALTSTYVPLTIANPTGVAETNDAIFTITGPWGPAISDPTGAAGNMAVINTSIIDIGTGYYVYFVIADNVPAGHSMIVDIGAGGMTKNTLDGSGNIIAVTNERDRLVKLDLQASFFRLRGGGDNNLVFSINGTPMATLNGKVLVGWRPKLPLA